jgi:hypothetical protein
MDLCRARREAVSSCTRGVSEPVRRLCPHPPDARGIAPDGGHESKRGGKPGEW